MYINILRIHRSICVHLCCTFISAISSHKYTVVTCTHTSRPTAKHTLCNTHSIISYLQESVWWVHQLIPPVFLVHKINASKTDISNQRQPPDDATVWFGYRSRLQPPGGATFQGSHRVAPQFEAASPRRPPDGATVRGGHQVAPQPYAQLIDAEPIHWRTAHWRSADSQNSTNSPSAPDSHWHACGRSSAAWLRPGVTDGALLTGDAVAQVQPGFVRAWLTARCWRETRSLKYSLASSGRDWRRAADWTWRAPLDGRHGRDTRADSPSPCSRGPRWRRSGPPTPTCRPSASNSQNWCANSAETRHKVTVGAQSA